MDITPYVESLRRDLLAATESSTDDTKAAAERLVMALDPAARLALMEAISHAANEITAEMPAGSVDVRLNGRELDFAVQAPHPAPSPPAPPPPPAAEEPADDGALARVTLRIPEAVKVQAEERAAKTGQSLNTWLVNVVRQATSSDHAINVDIDLSSLPFMGGNDPFSGAPFSGAPFSKGSNSNHRMTGWA